MLLCNKTDALAKFPEGTKTDNRAYVQGAYPRTSYPADRHRGDCGGIPLGNTEEASVENEAQNHLPS